MAGTNYLSSKYFCWELIKVVVRSPSDIKKVFRFSVSYSIQHFPKLSKTFWMFWPFLLERQDCGIIVAMNKSHKNTILMILATFGTWIVPVLDLYDTSNHFCVSLLWWNNSLHSLYPGCNLLLIGPYNWGSLTLCALIKCRLISITAVLYKLVFYAYEIS